MAPHTDIRVGDWIDRFLPSVARPYARLMRLDRPIGTWLLLLPCLWSVTLASEGRPSITMLFLFALGALVMRGAGCAINDLYDRHLDGKVERTATRPLPSGQVKPWQALLFVVALLLLGLAVLVQFNTFTILLGVASLALVFTYPLAKRVTWWPQFVLGLAFNWGALMGWSAVQGKLEAPAFLLYGAGIFWTLGYDTIYAHQDKEDDAKIGIKSLALKLGSRSRPVIAFFYAATLAGLALTGFVAKLDAPFYGVLFLAGQHAFWQVVLWRVDDPADSLRRFKSNRDFGLIILAALAVGKLL
ncbi:MAG: 4-hydroxybenzoate octaprenyltransferase [Bdellovibrionales bacterium]|jgi:4-hydroxybenzoate polyprenyltransferase